MFSDDLPLFDEPGTLEVEPLDAIGEAGPPLDANVAQFLGLRPFALPPLLGRRCTRRTLDGSWFMHLEPVWPHLTTAIRGPLRIEARAGVLRASADVYVRRGASAIEPIGTPITPLPFVVRRNWYPHLPAAEYAFFLRSASMTHFGDRLVIRVIRHTWNWEARRFGPTDDGSITLRCIHQLAHHARLPQPTVRLTGTARIGGRSYRVIATKTSPYYRGFSVDADVSARPAWGESAAGSLTRGFERAFHGAGLDARVTVDQCAPSLARCTVPTVDSAWRMRLLVGAGQAPVGAFATQAYGDPLAAVPVDLLRTRLAAVTADLPQTSISAAGELDPRLLDATHVSLVHAPDPLAAPAWGVESPPLRP